MKDREGQDKGEFIPAALKKMRTVIMTGYGFGTQFSKAFGIKGLVRQGKQVELFQNRFYKCRDNVQNSRPTGKDAKPKMGWLTKHKVGPEAGTLTKE